MTMKHPTSGRRLRVPSPTTVIACVALAVALGGTGYAAVVLPANSVGTPQLKRNAVVGTKIKGGAVSGAKVKADSLRGANILESSLGKVPSAANADSATNAADAALLGGLAADQFLGVNGKAADSDKLDGIDSSGLVRGVGTRYTFNLTCFGCTFNYFTGNAPGAGAISLACTGGTSHLRFYARFPFVNYDLWVDVDGTRTRTTASGLNPVFLTPDVAGIHHVSLRTQDLVGGTIGAYDIFLDGTNCQAMGVVDIAFPTSD
jgi:hypothetical protein